MNVSLKGKENGSTCFQSSSSISHQLIINLLNCVDGQAIHYMHCSNVDIVWASVKLGKSIIHLLPFQNNIVYHWITMIRSIHSVQIIQKYNFFQLCDICVEVFHVMHNEALAISKFIWAWGGWQWMLWHC